MLPSVDWYIVTYVDRSKKDFLSFDPLTLEMKALQTFEHRSIRRNIPEDYKQSVWYVIHQNNVWSQT